MYCVYTGSGNITRINILQQFSLKVQVYAILLICVMWITVFKYKMHVQINKPDISCGII